MFRRVAGRPVLPRMDLVAPAAGDGAVPAQDRVRGGQQPQPLAARLRYHACQGREQRAVRPRQLRAGRRLALQDHSCWHKITISAIFCASSRRDSRSHAANRVIRRKTNRKHMNR
jgi:hypothetical protein